MTDSTSGQGPPTNSAPSTPGTPSTPSLPPSSSVSTPVPPTTSRGTTTAPPTSSTSRTSSTSKTSSTSSSSSKTSSSSTSSTPSSSTSAPPSTSHTQPAVTVTKSRTTRVHIVTSTTLAGQGQTTAPTTSTTATPINPSGDQSQGLTEKSKVAIGVVVPIVAIAVLALVGLFFWKRRKARRLAEEERRKEVEDYSYNPNADPTIPAVGGAFGSENAYEMREDGSSGYRGWGTTVAGSSGRKASTTMSGGVAGAAFSDITSPTRGGASEARSGEPLLDGSQSPEGEILGAMGPSAANNRNGDVRRGPSNASSSYSAAGRSDGSDGAGYSYGNGGTYYDQYSQNPYTENNPNNGAPGQPVIRDNPARRNTRIENTSHYPQQSAGISQNF